MAAPTHPRQQVSGLRPVFSTPSAAQDAEVFEDSEVEEVDDASVLDESEDSPSDTEDQSSEDGPPRQKLVPCDDDNCSCCETVLEEAGLETETMHFYYLWLSLDLPDRMDQLKDEIAEAEWKNFQTHAESRRIDDLEKQLWKLEDEMMECETYGMGYWRECERKRETRPEEKFLTAEEMREDIRRREEKKNK